MKRVMAPRVPATLCVVGGIGCSAIKVVLLVLLDCCLQGIISTVASAAGPGPLPGELC